MTIVSLSWAQVLVTSLDLSVVERVAAARSPALVAVATVVTDAGSPAVMVALLVTAVCASAWRHRSARPLVVGAGGLVALTAIDLGVKSLVARPRPPVMWHAVTAEGWSFPSGHAVFSAGVLLLVTRLVVPLRTPSGRLLGVAAVLAVLGVGLSRVVLGVHYPTDVLAGWCLAVITDAGLLLAVGLVERRRTPRRDPRAAPRSATSTLDLRKAA